MIQKLQRCKETAAFSQMKKNGSNWAQFLKPTRVVCVLAYCLLGFIGISESNAQTNYALNLDGSNQYASVNNSSSLNFGSSTDFTLEAQILLNGSNSSFNGLVSKATSGSNWTGYQIAVYQNNLVGETGDGTSFVGVPQGLQGTTNLNDGNWHHVAMVVSRASKNAKLYVDGNLEASVTNAVIGNDISNSSNLYIGVERDVATFFNGKIDEVRVWNTARTQAQILANRFISVNPSSSGLVSYYNCNAGSGTVLADNSGSNTATLNNGTTWVVSTLVGYTYTVSGNNAFRDIGVNLSGVNTSDISSQVYSFDGSSWSAYSGAMTPGVGYRAQFAGNSSKTVHGTAVSNFVSVPINAGVGTFTFLANPFNGVLNFFFVLEFSDVPLTQGYWYLDPTKLVGGYEGYIYNGVSTGQSNTFAGALTLNGCIQPSQGFFVQNQVSSSGIMEFDRSYNGGASQNVFGTTAPLNRIATGLFKAGNNVDGAVAVFNSKFTNGIDKYDGSKINNQGENITFTLAGKDYCANAWSLPSIADELPMHLYNLQANTAYTVKLDASQFSGNGLDAYLQDNVLNTKTLLTGANNEVSFTTGSNATTDANRYTIVFGASPLPVKAINLTATASNNKVSINWSVAGESNITNYKVERSANATNFEELATVSPTTSHNYSYVDATTPSGAGVYYRIKATDKAGAVSYSNVVKLSTVNRSPLTVAPNPVTGSSFKLGLAVTGKYTVSLVDKLGQTVYTTTINHTSVATMESIALSSKLATGSYTVKAIHESGNVSTTQVIIK